MSILFGFLANVRCESQILSVFLMFLFKSNALPYWCRSRCAVCHIEIACEGAEFADRIPVESVRSEVEIFVKNHSPIPVPI